MSAFCLAHIHGCALEIGHFGERRSHPGSADVPSAIVAEGHCSGLRPLRGGRDARARRVAKRTLHVESVCSANGACPWVGSVFWTAAASEGGRSRARRRSPKRARIALRKRPISSVRLSSLTGQTLGLALEFVHLECGDVSPLSQARRVAPDKAPSCRRTPRGQTFGLAVHLCPP